MGPAKDRLNFDKEVSDAWCVLIPAGTWHNITNIGEDPMRLYAIYAPAHHKPGTILHGGGLCNRPHLTECE